MRIAAGRMLLPCVLLAIAAPAGAQGTGRSMDIDMSLRSAAMGGASNAVFRGGDLNHWGNPAFLGITRGLRYERGRTQLVPGLADDVWYDTRVTKFGYGGAGFVFGGDPVGPDGVQLDYGISDQTDQNGNVIGAFDSYEHVSSWGFGVSLVEAFGSLARLRGAEPPALGRWFDLSAGMNFKKVLIALAPATLSGTASTTGSDFGLLARCTPLDGLSSDRYPPVRVDLSYGWSVLNFTDNEATFLNEDVTTPLTRHRRRGLAIGLAAVRPPREAGRGFAAAFVRGLFPLVSATFAVDRARLGAGDAVDYETESSGMELTIANVVALRRGHYEDEVGNIDGSTRGYAVGLPLGAFGGFAWEEAWFPQANGSGLEDLHRTGWSVWLDPLEIAAAMRKGGE